MSASAKPATAPASDYDLPPVVDQVGEALLGGAMTMGVCAVALTLFATAPAFRPGGRGAWAVASKPRLAAPLVTITAAALATFLAYLGYTSRCGEGCSTGAAVVAGREVWWRTEAAWQWSGQLALASIGLAAAAVALVLAARGMRGVRPTTVVAQLVLAAWLGAALALPVAVELARG